MDSQLVKDFVSGTPQAAETIASWIRCAALSFRQRFGDDWEDVVATATLQVTEALLDGRFQGQGSLQGYVRRVSLTTCLDRLRSLQRWKWTELDAELLPTSPHSPADAVEAAEAWRLARQILDKVPEDCVRLWRMLIDGQSYKQMAEQLGIAAGTLRVRVLRCRRRAQEIRQQLLHPPQCNISCAQTPE